MLALTRRVGEEIVIGDPSNPLGVIRIVDIHGDKVRLSFDFPRELQINRRELADQKARESATTTQSDSPPHTPTHSPTHPHPHSHNDQKSQKSPPPHPTPSPPPPQPPKSS